MQGRLMHLGVCAGVFAFPSIHNVTRGTHERAIRKHEVTALTKQQFFGLELLGPVVEVMRKKVRQRDQHGEQSAHLLAGVGRAATNTRSQILVRPSTRAKTQDGLQCLA